MNNNISKNHPSLDQFVRVIIGFLISLFWPAFTALTIIETSDSRITIMQTWYVYVLYSLAGITLWLILKNIPRIKAITLFGVPCLAVILIYYSVNAYASRGETLFIGILLYTNAEGIGNIVYAISITSFMALSESAKRIPYGTFLLVLAPYFFTFIPDEYAGSFLSNLIIWTAILAGSIGYLNLFVDLILCLRWEFLNPGESHA